MQTESYQLLLLNEKANVLASLGYKPGAGAGDGRLGEEDQAQVSNDEFVSLRLNNLEYEKLRLLNAALDRLREGEYGICTRCDQPIPPRRLQVLPWAKYCVPCQEHVSLYEGEETVGTNSFGSLDDVH
ncbi:MAG: TraR/DksA family transcriptional regulator [Bryobacteraceae bacterium]